MQPTSAKGALDRSFRLWRYPTWANLLIVLPLVFGVSLSIYQSVVHGVVASRQQIATGVVASHEPANHDQYGYRFSVDGKWYRGLDGSPTGALKIGQEVRVYYDPLDPTTSGLVDFSEVRIRELSLVPIMLVGIAGVAFCIFLMRRINRTTSLDSER